MTLADAGIDRAFGGSADGDPGLFGPYSVTWQLHTDPALWIAGVSSLYLQSLHPLAVAAVVQNSGFREDPVGRLVRTADFVGYTTYGTSDEANAIAGRVRGIHRTLRAVDPISGRRFRIDEPELLLWVHCSQVWSFADVVRRSGFPLTDRQLDRYFAEQRRSAELVGLHADEVPGSLAEMVAYFDETRPLLRRTAESDEVFEFLRRPPVPWLLARASYYPIGQLGYSMLPRWAIELHGRTPIPQLPAELAARSIRTAMLLVPEWLRKAASGETYPDRAVARLGPWAAPSLDKMPSR
ncbi:DUF2236 domain-containing protein [Pseudonocardiaceae bacterium YIM PH 21723]|nr:DUF2236 domain-containing protein [Pseudonocardiaceae bacterium YIM PH 21723]